MGPKIWELITSEDKKRKSEDKSIKSICKYYMTGVDFIQVVFDT